MLYLNPCHLRAVGYKADPPLVQFTDYCWNLTCPMPGNAVEYLNIALQLMNCSGEVIQLDIGAEDVFDYLVNNTADISILPLRQTIQRMEKAFFTLPVSYLYYGYLIKEIPQIQVEDYIFSSFAPSVLVLLVITALLVGALVYFFSIFMKRNNGNMVDWFILSAQALVGQFNCSISGPVAAQLLIGFWLVFCLIVDHNFQAKLKSFLTLSHTRGTIFTTMDGMIDAILYQDWTLVLQQRGFSPDNYCTADQCQRLRTIPADKIITVVTDDEFLDTVSQEKHVGFIAYTFDVTQYPITYMDVKRSLLFVRDTEAVPEFLAYVVRKNFRGLREAFNDAVSISAPAFVASRGLYTAEYAQYNNNPNGNLKGGITVLKLQHLIALYRISGELALGALILLGLELVYFRFGIRILHKVRHLLPVRFSHVLHINNLPEKNICFIRSNTVVLPPRRTLSPVKRIYAKFYTC